MNVIAWLVLIWCIVMSVVLLVMMCLCCVAVRTDRELERHEDEL